MYVAPLALTARSNYGPSRIPTCPTVLGHGQSDLVLLNWCSTDFTVQAPNYTDSFIRSFLGPFP